jgi:hypothetical protein
VRVLLPEPESARTLMCSYMYTWLAQTYTLEGGSLRSEPSQGSPHRIQVSPAEEVGMH